MDKGRLPPLEWIRAFEAAARLGSFTAAAAETGLTQSAISQRIAQLESFLAAGLFHRRARTIALTVEGEAWLPHVRRALDDLRDSSESLFGAGSKRLTLSASQSIIELWLMPRMAKVRTLTGAQVSIQTLVVGAHDAPQDDVIRIRYGAGDWPHPYRAKLFAEEIVAVAAPALARQPDSWTGLPRIACAGPRPGWNDWASRFGIPTTPIPKLGFDTLSSALAAAKAGLGVALASLPLCAPALQRGELVRLDERSILHHESYWLLASRTSLPRHQWEALADALVDPLGRHKDGHRKS